MNKSKERRVRKELDKLLSSGKYWEWLDKINAENLQDVSNKLDGLDKQMKDVWQSLAKQALRLPGRLTDFLRKLKGITSYPDIPDVKFLFLLRDFIYEDNLSTELLTLKGLSLPAEELRKRAATWNDDVFPEKEVRKILDAFVKRPEKITKKYYLDLAPMTNKLFNDRALLLSFKRLGDDIAYIRSIGTKGHNKVNITKLNDIDIRLLFIARNLPSGLHKVISYPFIFQMNKYLRSLPGNAPAVTIAKIVSAIPYLFSLVAGDKAGEVGERLMHYNPHDIDHKYLAKKISQGSFEERVALIGTIRRLSKDGEREVYSKYMFSLYKGILSDVAKRLGHLSEREKRELPRVLGGAMLQDIHILWGTPYELADILLSAAESGCLEIRLSMLSLLVAGELKLRKLREFAENTIRKPLKITIEDIDWLMSECSFVVFPRVSLLKSILDLLGDEKKLIEVMADMVLQELQSILFINSVVRHNGEIPFPMEMMGFTERKEDLRILRKELVSLRGYEAFNFLIDYIECYPDGCFTETAHRCALNKVYAWGGVSALLWEIKNINLKKSEFNDLTDDAYGSLPGDDSLYKLVRQKEKAAFDALREHWEDLKTANISTIEDLTEIIAKYYSKDPIIIRLSNLLEHRCQHGEAIFKPLKIKVSELLGRLKNSKIRTRRSK
ncbi:MAG: hypothetical protein HQK99_09395 [Nitrospirae bacterium]|nr:hypothetical protein [Nitrospirota bacterium]